MTAIRAASRAAPVNTFLVIHALPNSAIPNTRMSSIGTTRANSTRLWPFSSFRPVRSVDPIVIPSDPAAGKASRFHALPGGLPGSARIRRDTLATGHDPLVQVHHAVPEHRQSGYGNHCDEDDD